MHISEYQQISQRTLSKNLTYAQQLPNYCMGLAGEAGEVIDLLKKHIYHHHKLSYDQLKSELGDVLWYVAAICSMTGIDLEDVASFNILKLQQRYPNGFDPVQSQHRSTE